MGNFFNSIQVKDRPREQVLTSIKAIEKKYGGKFYVGPTLEGWIGVYPSLSPHHDTIAQVLAKRLKGTVWRLLVHDDDVLAYWLWHDAELVDSYWSAPGYFGEDNLADEEQMRGDPEVLSRLIGGKTRALQKLLDRSKRPAFAFQQLEALQRAVGMRNLLTSYEDLKRFDGAGIEGWSNFEEIPPEDVSEEAEQKRLYRAHYETTWQRLKSEGLLLLADVHEEDRPCGCAADGGFIVAWPNYRWRRCSFAQYKPPWDKPEILKLDLRPHVTGVASNASGKRVAISGAGQALVWDITPSGWKPVVEIPEKHLAAGAAVSPDGKLLVHASTDRETIILTNLANGKRVLSCAGSTRDQFAFHPSGEWIVASANPLVLLALSEKPVRRELFVDGRRVLSAEERAEQIEIGYTEEQIDNEKPTSNATVECAGFSDDGQWLWCGTDQGLNVYEWETVPRTSGAEMPQPKWRFGTPNQPWTEVTPTIFMVPLVAVLAAVQEGSAPAIVFGGMTGKLYRLDLLTGETRELIEFTGDTTQICALAMSADGLALGIATRTFSLRGIGVKKYEPERWTWQIWNYPELRESPLLQVPSPPPAN